MESKDLQRQIFTKIISNPETLASNIAKISPDDFTVPLIKTTVGALSKNGYVTHYSKNKNFFEILLRGEIKEPKKLGQAAEMLSNVASTEGVDTTDLDVLIKELKAERMCREMSRILSEIVPDITPEKIEATYDRLMKSMLRLPLKAASSAAVSVSREVFGDVENRTLSYFDPKKAKFPTGIKAFDKAIGGFAPGELVILSAGTGQGKSAVMLWWANQFVDAGANCLYITIEMSYDESMERYNAMVTGFPASDIRNKRIQSREIHNYFESLIAHSLDPDVRAGFLKECEKIVARHEPKHALALAKSFKKRQSKFFVVDMPQHCTPSRVEHEVRRLILDQKIDYVFVDFLNVMDPEYRMRNDVKELASIARDLKLVARKTETVVFSACQLNTSGLKDKEGDIKREITTDDLKYAKAIGENSDWVIAFHRDPNDRMMKQIRLQLAKHRHAANCVALLEFDFNTFRAKDLGDEKDYEANGPIDGYQSKPSFSKGREWH